MRLQPNNPMNRALASLLIFDVVVFGLAFPGMVLISDVSPMTAGIACGVSMIPAIASAASLRRPIGHPLGWLTQIVGIALGFLTPMMFIMGGVFALIWVMSFILGKRLEGAEAF